jgi:phosphoribosylanthranilate isomerase
MAANVLPVGVFVSPADEDIARARDAGVRVIQVHGERRDTASGEVWVAFSLEGAFDDLSSDATLLLDAHDPVRHGGTGRTIDWARAAAIATRRRVMLAGGLTPDNVADAIRQVKPYGVDVASGIEERPGIKSAAAMKAFVAAVREADQ